MWTALNLDTLPSPCFVVDEARLRANLELLDDVQRRGGCRILLALKGFAMFSLFPLCRRHLAGACASGPLEARLAREEFGGEVHTFAPAYSAADFAEVLALSDYVIFNSFASWRRFQDRVLRAPRRVSCGLRINPEYSEVGVALYNPCAPNSRLGITRAAFEPEHLGGIEGLHFHCLCEQNADALERTLEAVEAKFGAFIPRMKWMNFGGGHHITRADYDVERLVRLLCGFRKRWPHLEAVYLEPGEAVALNTGVLAATVLDIVRNGLEIAILDTSAEAHMPDVLAMPYRPEIVGAGRPGEHPHTYRLGGLTCLAGDVIGDYSFPRPLRPGDRLLFLDMAHYSMVKTTTFNGMRLPAIAIWNSETGAVRLVRQFGYQDYRGRLS
ncbi:MAG: Carboxynorspermidine/carboxyspermidine decarboxylase [Lentisphaerae bacterium ADurb.BinA184]|nr:MAG: Carboxynorspermidine/carboxyspermidine decarboxylase [Lentisphaerae bacterium ADurb.BinA184]